MNTSKSLFKEFEEEIDETNKTIEENGITIVLHKEEFHIQNESLISYLIPLLTKIKYCYDSKSNTFKIPKSIDKSTFDLFLHFISYFNSITDISFLSKVDLPLIRNCIPVCLFFEEYELISSIVNQFIIPKNNKENCLEIILYFSDLTDIQSIKDIFTDIINDAYNTTSLNLLYLLNHQREKLIALDSTVIENLIELHFKTCFSNNFPDDSLIMSLLMYNRKIKNDIFELLENERKRAIANFERNYLKAKAQFTILTCKIKSNDPSNGLYKEELIQIENLDVLLMIYYDSKNNIFNLALQIKQINPIQFSNTIINAYEKSNSNCDTKFNIINTNTFNDKNNNDNSDSREYLADNHIISILSACEIEEIKFQTKTNFNCIYSNSKSRVLVFKIEKFSHYFQQESFIQGSSVDFSLKLYFSINYNFSSILNHICKSFHDYYSLSSIIKLSKIVLNIILKNDCLCCKSGDEVLYAIINWLSNKSNYHLNSSIDLFKNVNWKNVSLEALINLLLFDNKILMAVSQLKGIVFNEFKRRFQEDLIESERDYSVSMTETEIYDSSCNFNRMKFGHFTFDLLNSILTISNNYNFASLIKRGVSKIDQRINEQGGISLTTPTVEKESSLDLVSKQPNRNKSNGSHLTSMTNTHANTHTQTNTQTHTNSSSYQITTSFLLKKNDRISKKLNNIISVRNIPTITGVNKLTSQSLNKPKQADMGIKKNSASNLQINVNSDFLCNPISSIKSKLKSNRKTDNKSIIGRLLIRANTPDDVANKQSSMLNLNKSNHSITNKSNSLERRKKSITKFPQYLIQNNYLSFKRIKTHNDRSIPINKHVTTSSRSELMKTEPQSSQAKKIEIKKIIHYRSQSNH